MIRSALRLVALLAAAAVISGSGSATATANQLWSAGAPPPLQGPVVIGLAGPTGLEYLPLGPHGGRKPTGIAADGRRLAIADGAQTVVYDLLTKHETVLTDSTGMAIDEGIAGAPNFISQHTYPDGKPLGKYSARERDQ